MDEQVATEVDPAVASNMNDTDVESMSVLRKSALQDNIDKKGKHAYYFAHSHKANGPAWDGKVEPKLLSRMSVSSLSEENDNINRIMSKPTEKKSSFDYSKSNITTYAFLDDGAKIKLYIDLENVGEQCTDNDITLDYTDRTLSFKLLNYKHYKLSHGIVNPTTQADDDKDKGNVLDPTGSSFLSSPSATPQILCFGRLCGEICNATYRIKKDKIILTLTKVDPSKSWATINDQGVVTDHHEIV